MEFIHILEGHFHGDAFALTGKENDIMDGLFGTVHVFYEANDAFRFMVGNLLRFFFSLIFKNDRKLRIQISGLMQTTLYFIFLETGLVKDGVIRQKVDSRTGLSVLPTTGSRPSTRSITGIPLS